MIEVREAPVPLSGEQIPGVAGGPRLREVPDVLLLAVGDDRGTPPIALWIPGDSHAAREVVALAAPVARVLSGARCAQVLTTVVERIPIDVIDLLAGTRRHDGPMQVDVAVAILPGGHPGVVVAPLQVPDAPVVRVTDERRLSF